jgi:hypothetical protein
MRKICMQSNSSEALSVQVHWWSPVEIHQAVLKISRSQYRPSDASTIRCQHSSLGACAEFARDRTHPNHCPYKSTGEVWSKSVVPFSRYRVHNIGRDGQTHRSTDARTDGAHFHSYCINTFGVGGSQQDRRYPDAHVRWTIGSRKWKCFEILHKQYRPIRWLHSSLVCAKCARDRTHPRHCPYKSTSIVWSKSIKPFSRYRIHSIDKSDASTYH